ncbi:linamarin synthase 2-like [Vigna unguiculata]|uniref:Glycosyltransferase n=1 Tax=Vigna unguiculata TaxID=3917 RepID=A0A4D6KM55_VIGUN|nr:linamarin synthase 2-like [Vigna unguiculata]QCD79146.1 cyanohydrin beta-glucosyltransferase [Vigna unguiculata]
MASVETPKPHIVCVPYPAQGHINPMMQLAKILRCKGFYITFVNSEYNHRRFVKSHGPEFVKGLPDFVYETIPDGLPPSDKDATQDIPMLCDSTRKTCYGPFKELVLKLKATEGVPPITGVIADGIMGFAGKVAKDMGIPEVQLWTASVCGYVGYLQFDELVAQGMVPFKDQKEIDDALDISLDWIKGMSNMRLRDLPTFCRVTSLDDILFDFLNSESRNCLKSSAVIINTFEDLDEEGLEILRSYNPNIYTIGPLDLLGRHFPEKEKGFMSVGSSLWKNDSNCLTWLNKWEPNSVVYVNFGSIAVMTAHHLKEFAWGLANSKLPFLWIKRADIVTDDSDPLPQEFFDEIKDRGYITSWCMQEQVLSHPSVGVFLTHCGWNSTLEGIYAGVPMVCWPFFSDQHTNCRYVCANWGVGMEINQDVKRDEISDLVTEMIKGEKGNAIRQKSLEWKKKAIKATDVGGTSYNHIHKLIKEALSGNAA